MTYQVGFLGSQGIRGPAGPTGPAGPSGAAGGGSSTDTTSWAVTGGSFVNPTAAAVTVTLGTAKSILLSIHAEHFITGGGGGVCCASWKVHNNSSATDVYLPTVANSPHYQAVNTGIHLPVAGSLFLASGLGNSGDTLVITPQFDLGGTNTGFLGYVSISVVSF